MLILEYISFGQSTKFVRKLRIEFDYVRSLGFILHLISYASVSNGQFFFPFKM